MKHFFISALHYTAQHHIDQGPPQDEASSPITIVDERRAQVRDPTSVSPEETVYHDPPTHTNGQSIPSTTSQSHGQVSPSAARRSEDAFADATAGAQDSFTEHLPRYER